jgi:hypothetical protein
MENSGTTKAANTGTGRGILLRQESLRVKMNSF